MNQYEPSHFLHMPHMPKISQDHRFLDAMVAYQWCFRKLSVAICCHLTISYVVCAYYVPPAVMVWRFGGLLLA